MVPRTTLSGAAARDCNDAQGSGRGLLHLHGQLARNEQEAGQEDGGVEGE